MNTRPSATGALAVTTLVAAGAPSGRSLPLFPSRAAAVVPPAPLASYRWIVVSTSAGKDSLAMLDVVAELARSAGVLDRVVAVHCDLGRVEWPGTRELAERQARALGVRFEVVTRRQGDLLAHVRQRRMWPGMGRTRYCTSDHKRGQVHRVVTQLGREAPGAVLSCLGLRAAESPGRSKLRAVQLCEPARLQTRARRVDTWLPLHAWSAADVWQRIRSRGLEYHPVYDQGMPRLSCSFCIYAPRSALLRAGQLRPELLAEYVELEREIGHTFKPALALADVQAALQAGELPGEIKSWEM